MILAGDIGGTRTRLALFTPEGVCAQEKWFPSQHYASLEEVIRAFLALYPTKIEKACFGVAGPVVEGRCATTNLPWIIEEKELKKLLNTPHCFLLNDLLANAYGIGCLKETDFAVLQKGELLSGNRALIAAGTGLGEAGLYWDGKKHYPFPCEGGHVDFAPRSSQEMELLKFLQERFEHVSYERVISGPGFYHLYQFLIASGRGKERKDVLEEMEKEDPAMVITQRGLQGTCPTCEHVLEWFSSLYGAEAGNLALKFLALGGLYIGGGIAPQILPALQKGKFLQSFLAKGRFSPLLAKIPLKVILNPDAALLGAAFFARSVAL